MSTTPPAAMWDGPLKDGQGTLKLNDATDALNFSFATRFEDQPGATPEDLIGAALAGCFSMALSAELGEASHAPEHIETAADVQLQKEPSGFAISRISLTCRARVPGIDEAEFSRLAERTRKTCPVAKALTGTKIEVDAGLLD